jgi:hypothetical protein
VVLQLGGWAWGLTTSHLKNFFLLRNISKRLRPGRTIVRVITSRRMRWAERVARMEEMRNSYRILVGKRDRKRDLGIGGRIILKWSLDI